MKGVTKLTSVKIITDLYKKFKGVALNEEFTLQKLVNRSMDKYLNDEDYKKSIVEYDELHISGSNFLNNYNKEGYMSKKKILLLSDDLRMSSGVGTVSKNFVLGTLDKYDWVQIAGAIKTSRRR